MPHAPASSSTSPTLGVRSWSPTGEGVEVPGDHFSMIATHAETTAQAIREALDLQTTDKQPEKG